MQQILKPSVCNQWNALYAQRTPLARNERSIDWPTIEALLHKTRQSTSKSNNNINNIITRRSDDDFNDT